MHYTVYTYLLNKNCPRADHYLHNYNYIQFLPSFITCNSCTASYSDEIYVVLCPAHNKDIVVVDNICSFRN